jgi:large subunit ribosomal protein L22
MRFIAKARYVRYSPYKLRLLADVIRGKNVQYALNWLSTCALRRANPLYKVVASAAANARDVKNVATTHLSICEIRVDEGPTFNYFKPGAMGRANVQKKRISHISVTVESISNNEV